jgi:membrane-bound lytic murein transglycosylase MltF
MKYGVCVLVAAMALGCGGDSPGGSDSLSNSGESGSLLDGSGVPGLEQLLEPWSGDFDGMVERRVIRALVVHSRMLYFLDGGRPRGLTYEAMKMFEEGINEALGTDHLKVHVVLIPVPRDQLIPALAAGRGDIAAANLTITPERLETVDFSDPLLTGVKEIVVTGPGTPAPQSIEDLAETEIHVRESSSYYASLTKLNQEFERVGRDPIRIEPADELLEDEDNFWAKVFDDVTLNPDVAVRTGGGIGWAFRKGSPKLAETINEFVRKHKKGTLIGNMTLNRYLKDVDYVVNPTAGEDGRRLRDTEPVFRKYAEQYDFDPLLVTAQAYQESRLDQSVVSSVGALGVMQIRPSTADDPNVGISGIDKLENNVHAGVRYMRFIKDRYFSDDEIDRLNQHLLAMAAYNAGPARIAKLRAKAAEQGLDPNVWFRSVERVAAEEIGRETVQRVGIRRLTLGLSRL